MSTEATTQSTESHNSLTPGQKLAGCYVLGREISSESRLSVWLAQDEVLGKEVSLHFIPASVLNDERGMAELRQEVKRNRQLIHPNILRIYDFVEDAGVAAISMDRFDGESLATLLAKKGKFEAGEIRAWIQQIAGTLDDAHRVQLFHRDLAPANIYVKPSGGVFVTNFGVARCVRDAMERTQSLSSEELHMAYMSPQQLDGEKPAKSDDVYGLGVLAFELLSGKVPFSGPDVVPSIRTAPPTMIAEALGSAVPLEWETFAAECLSKVPDLRPASCGAALQLLEVKQDSSEAAPLTLAAVEAIAAQGQIDESAPAETEPVPVENPAAKQSAAERRVSFSANLEPATTPETPQPVAKILPPLESTSASTEKETPGSALQFPPVPPASAQPRPPGSKSDLPANFPELSRPRSKWPIVGVGLAAALVAFAVVQKLKIGQPEDVDGAVSSISSDSNPNSSGAVEPLPASTPDQSPKAVLASANLGSPDEDGLPVPKAIDSQATAQTGGSDNLPPADAAGTLKSGDIVPEIKPENAVAAVAPAVSATGQPPAPKPPKRSQLIGVVPPVAPPADPPKVEETPKPPVAVVPPVTPPPTPAPDPAVTPTVVVAPTAQIPETPAAAVTVKLPTIPGGPAKLQIPTGADAAALSSLLAERLAAETSLKQALGTTEQAQQELARLSESSKKTQDTLKKTFDERRKQLAPILKQNEALLADRKKREDEAARAEAQALEARKAADASKMALEALVKQASEKLESAKQADEELKRLAQQIAEQTTQAEALQKNQTQAAAVRQQAGLGLQQIEQEKATLNTALEKVKAAAMEAVRAKNQGRIAELTKKAQPLEVESTKLKGMLTQLKEIGEPGVAASKPISERLATVEAELKSLKEDIIKLNSPSSATQPNEAPKPEPAPTSSTPPAKAADAGSSANVNTLGMKFIQIGDVDFAEFLVTRKNFEGFANEKGLKGGAWRTPGFEQQPDHPVVNVTWKEADAFCKWLTERERKTGALAAAESYRLPTDLEWSRAVGLPPENGNSPEERDLNVDGVFPWGLAWPPPAGAGNYAGEETNSEVKIQGYRDDYAWTSPVGKFNQNAFGLYDMGGNVWQWTNDYFNESKERKVLRGGSWYNGGVKLSLLASCRITAKPDASNDTYGFRLVKTHETTKTTQKSK